MFVIRRIRNEGGKWQSTVLKSLLPHTVRLIPFKKAYFFKRFMEQVMDINPAKEDKKKYYRKSSRVNFLLASTIDPNAIIYKLFTRENPDQEILLTEENIASKNLVKSVKTVLIIHGWTSSDSTPWYKPLKDAFLLHGPYNIICINWATYGDLDYGVSCANVKPVGDVIARFLGKSLVTAENIHLIGHSLGAHLAAFTGKAYEKEYGQKIGRITGLDPAGPKWSNKEINREEKLSELDASFVDVIHTDIQMYGYTYPCGHVDFYPNGGTEQPGYTDQQEGENFNHRRSTWFFIESISTQVKASEITFKEDEDYNIVITPKENAKQVVFGEHVNSEDRGVYFLETNPIQPFLK